jgi:catechol 2,3-dioxygenase-like lactoylglutathione lyase family enzyme
MANMVKTGHVGLNVTDVRRSTQFYNTVLGLETITESSAPGREFAFIGRAGEIVLTLWRQSDGQFQKKIPGLHHLSFQVETVEDVRAVEARVKQAGGKLHYDGVVPHAEGAESGGIFFEDPDGIRLEVFAPSGVSGSVPTPGAPSCGFF